mmetsp:Transcript_5629/g.5140  ORF Transcript_5629/g.5140 Transcript_5629/m.5140 type:complete len:150 (+) Transcript_5629:1041-1490(+)
MLGFPLFGLVLRGLVLRLLLGHLPLRLVHWKSYLVLVVLVGGAGLEGVLHLRELVEVLVLLGVASLTRKRSLLLILHVSHHHARHFELLGPGLLRHGVFQVQRTHLLVQVLRVGLAPLERQFPFQRLELLQLHVGTVGRLRQQWVSRVH